MSASANVLLHDASAGTATELGTMNHHPSKGPRGRRAQPIIKHSDSIIQLDSFVIFLQITLNASCYASQLAVVMSKSPDVTQDLLPARMLNEFVYCPRLFFYEHVEGVFVHSEDTRRGSEDHKRVDGGKGDLPKARKRKPDSEPDVSSEADDPTEEAASESKTSETPEASAGASTLETEVIHSRSVMLGSESLGVVAKLDLVEATLEPSSSNTTLAFVARVSPVEYKAGAPRQNLSDGSIELWDPDRMQLALQILLLRENGYPCEEGVVFYRQTRQRVRYLLTSEDEAWVRQTIGAARSCTRGTIPAPLDHSPKCPRCSLVSVCLPDETRLLQGTPDEDLIPELQLGLPGLTAEETALADPDSLAETLSKEPSWEGLTESAPPRPAQPVIVRRLIAPDIDTKALYVATPGISVTKKGDIVVMKDKASVLAEVRIKDLHHLAIFGPTSLSTALVQTLCERDIPISYFSMGGWFYGLTRGHGLTNVFTRIQQFRRAGNLELSLPLARLFI